MVALASVENAVYTLKLGAPSQHEEQDWIQEWAVLTSCFGEKIFLPDGGFAKSQARRYHLYWQGALEQLLRTTSARTTSDALREAALKLVDAYVHNVGRDRWIEGMGYYLALSDMHGPGRDPDFPTVTEHVRTKHFADLPHTGRRDWFCPGHLRKHHKSVICSLVSSN